MLPISLGNCLSIDKCPLINLCHQSRQGLKIELCYIELRWSLAQLKQLRVLIHQSIPYTIHGQTFADCCLYLFRPLFRDIAIWPLLSSLYGKLGFMLGLNKPGRLSLSKKIDKVITTHSVTAHSGISSEANRPIDTCINHTCGPKCCGLIKCIYTLKLQKVYKMNITHDVTLKKRGAKQVKQDQ